MTDFVDVLEEQLIAAHGRRPRPAPPWRAGVVVVAAVAVAAVIVAVVIGLSSPSTQQGSPAPAQQPPPQTAPAPTPRRTSIAVLNGTTIVGLARSVADELTANGYHEPNVVTNDTTDQHRATTEIFYEDGGHDEAFAVASCLDVRFDHVHPMTADARALADRAQVAVFVGADKAR
jgi:ABC-type phosphate transport system substrate-binding protein